MYKYIKRGLPVGLILAPQLALGQDADSTPLNAEIGFNFTTFMFLVLGVLVFFMAAGFACDAWGLPLFTSAN